METQAKLARKEREFERHKIVVSVDLGKRQDFTCITVCETARDVRKNARDRYFDEVVINVRDIQRLPLGTDYDDISRHVYDLYNDERLALYEPKKNAYVYPQVLVDVGGVGDAVADILSKVIGMPFVRYQLVRGTTTDRQDSRLKFTVSRTLIFQRLYAAFNNDRVRIDPRLRLAKELVAELKALEVERNEETAAERVVHREGEHDDMSICLASTVWWVDRDKPRRRVIARGPDDPVVAKLLGIPPEAERKARMGELKEGLEPKPHTPIRMPGSRRMSAWR